MDPNGIHRARNFDTQREARDHKAEVRVAKKQGRYIDPKASKILFSDFSAKYLNQKVKLRPRTREKYASSLRVHLVPAFGNTPLAKVDGNRDQVQAWVLQMMESGFQPETIRGHYALLSSIMLFAVEEGLVARTPCHKIELPPITQDEQRFLSEEEVERLVEAMPDRYKALVYSAAYLGCRWQELAGLRRSNLSMRPGQLATVRIVTTIERANNRYAVVEYGKSKAARRTLEDAGLPP